MKRRRRIAILLGLLVGCGASLRADTTFPWRQRFQGSYALSAHGNIRIENRYGDVCITVWDRDEVRIEAIKSAGDAGRLADASIIVDSTAERLSLRTQYAGAAEGEPA